MADLKALIAKAATGAPLTRAEASEAFNVLMSGEATPAQIGGLLMLMRVRGETVDEIAGAVEVMRAKMTTVSAPASAIDIVGTGGDASGSYNVSTCAAFIVAGAGVPVAKHGNRALSSRSGAADVLSALGVRIDLSPIGIAACIEKAGIGFMFAPAHHAAMKHVGPARVELGTRTVFNLLGPLSNPAGVKRQLVGVYSRDWVRPLADVLNTLGTERAIVVHGSDGLDEMTTTGETFVASVEDGAVSEYTVEPGALGLARAEPSDLVGGDAAHNAEALRAVLGGASGAYRDIAALNAGAALHVAGAAETLEEGLALAFRSLDEGLALTRLNALVTVADAVAP
ncbi:anthranilate phosphoribosyltransferase [Acuticoccus sp. MNP-M23]|uniref:anthranilate phosphoribosyltransferase n=1 Tax=Acuticoccus sp. MNP-M23 TaxID=3072793 RepID=UPI0028157609|nr:anthranilate phosphoribosyltransferase [Acuticoccus sp. MNP-M23]WMS41317.1 anthranilate phosphoribosyltransferase [Acuticoccus sp. MNP-M23]